MRELVAVMKAHHSGSEPALAAFALFRISNVPSLHNPPDTLVSSGGPFSHRRKQCYCAKKRSSGSSCVGHYARRGVVPARVVLAITLSSSGREHGVIYPA